MAGTKFKVKKFETHQDGDVKYEFGAEINQDFPIEAPAGAAGKLVVNHDLEVTSGLVVGDSVNKDDAITMHSNDFTVNSSSEVEFKVDSDTSNKYFKVTTEESGAESTLFSVAPNLGTDTSDPENHVTMSEVNIGPSLDLYRAIMYAKYIGLYSVNDLILGSTSGKVMCKVAEEFLLTNVGNSSAPNTPIGLKIRRPENSTGYLQISEYNASTDTDTGLRLVYEGDAQSENLDIQPTTSDSNYSALQVLDSGTVSTILKSNASGTSVVLGKSLLGSDSSDGVINQTNVQGDKIRLNASGEVTVDSERFHFENTDHFIQPPESTGILRVYQPGSDEIPFSDETSSDPYNHTKPTGVEIASDQHGSAYVGVFESSTVDSGTRLGGRFVYQGVNPTIDGDAAQPESERLGVDTNNTVALQGYSHGSIYNILTYGYNGANTTLKAYSGELSLGTSNIVTQLNASTLDIDAASADIDVSGAIGIDAASAAINVSGTIDIDATNFQVDCTGAVRLKANGTSEAELRGYSLDIISTGTNIDIDSESSITMDAKTAIDIDAVTTLTLEGNQVHLKCGSSGLKFTGVPADTNINWGSPDQYYLGVNVGNGLVKFANTGFFSGTHVYKSSQEIPIGNSVDFLNGELSNSASPRSKICSGIVVSCTECTQEKAYPTSLGETLTSGYLIYVISVGDARAGECLGFNVCNENGDIEPGDLLVTSSTPGYLMKQDDDIIRSCTVGKAMENVIFNEQGQAVGVYGYLYCG